MAMSNTGNVKIRLEVDVTNVTSEELESFEKHPHYYMNGAFGNVLCVRMNGVDVAVKRFHQHTSHKLLMNYHELNHLASCNHENIVNVLGAGPDIYHNKLEYILMEFADCGSLHQVLHKYRPLPPYTLSHVIDWSLQCAKGAQYLHERHIIHRDLKPANLLLFQGGRRLKLCDFGTVKKTDVTLNTSERGTFVYMSPEVMLSNDKSQSHYNEKCDVYSWAFILWEMLTRRIPFQKMNACIIVLHVLIRSQRLEDIPDCPPVLQQLLKRAWHKNFALRPSMADLAAMMSAMLRHMPPPQYPLSVVWRPWSSLVPNQQVPTTVSVPSNQSNLGLPPGLRGPDVTAPTHLANDWGSVDCDHSHVAASHDITPEGDISAEDREIIKALVRPELLPMNPLPNDMESQSLHESHQQLLEQYCTLQKHVDLLTEKFHYRLRFMAKSNEELDRMQRYCMAHLDMERLSTQLHPPENS